MIGADLKAASYAFPGAGAFGTLSYSGVGAAGSAAAVTGTAAMTAIGTAVSYLGAGLVLQGIANVISPQPPNTALDEAVQLESFTFSNVVNTSRQGMPVPIAYGRVFVGSAVLSSGLDVDQKQA